MWIGAEEDNKSWRLLLDARQAFDSAANVSAERKQRAREEILIAEGSDWNWWYGPEHESANAVEFDQIYREHLANVYRALGVADAAGAFFADSEDHEEKRRRPRRSAPCHRRINGVVDSYFEWLGAGVYRVDQRSGSMHGKRALVQEVRYGGERFRTCFCGSISREDAANIEGLEIHGGDTWKRTEQPERRLKV